MSGIVTVPSLVAVGATIHLLSLLYTIYCLTKLLRRESLARTWVKRVVGTQILNLLYQLSLYIVYYVVYNGIVDRWLTIVNNILSLGCILFDLEILQMYSVLDNETITATRVSRIRFFFLASFVLCNMTSWYICIWVTSRTDIGWEAALMNISVQLFTINQGLCLLWALMASFYDVAQMAFLVRLVFSRKRKTSENEKALTTFKQMAIIVAVLVVLDWLGIGLFVVGSIPGILDWSSGYSTAFICFDIGNL
ncbi:hypothetical protein HDU91_003407, partial [Kappamyces sp. JEL0680]